MKVLVVGAAGMLGHKLFEVLSPRCDCWGTVRGEPSGYEFHFGPKIQRLHGGVTAQDLNSVVAVLASTRPDVVVNCVGIVKQVSAAQDVVQSIAVNALFPHQMATLCRIAGARFLHLSTDCVFSGSRGNYSETSVPDARDLYGRAKLLGEVVEDGSLTVRTSMIGRELGTRKGLLEWFLANRGGTVQGFRKAIFSGLTTAELSEVLWRLIYRHQDLSGLLHVSGPSISKFELLQLLEERFDTGTTIEGVEEPAIDRSLDSSRFRRLTGYEPPAWREMLLRL